jgi:hypothetical protein
MLIKQFLLDSVNLQSDSLQKVVLQNKILKS